MVDFVFKKRCIPVFKNNISFFLIFHHVQIDSQITSEHHTPIFINPFGAKLSVTMLLALDKKIT